ncbi:hypothetical protein M153_2220009188 [Pseudoloma neurophilia]|uniref:Uncharacterized protein n=1 Tax=Pseudoloma neurophilia TaxID=146866 RepID=A0A0R0M5Y3_9MICR|nr:hypothetical protein M153_2220009188 [Pseudoloma neurophilia]
MFYFYEAVFFVSEEFFVESMSLISIMNNVCFYFVSILNSEIFSKLKCSDKIHIT